MTDEAICGTEFNYCVNYPILRFRVLQVKFKTLVNYFIELLELLCISDIEARADFTQNPYSYSNDEISWIIFLNELFHLFNDFFSKFMRLLVVFNNKVQEIVQNARREVFASELEQNFHCLEIPFVSR